MLRSLFPFLLVGVLLSGCEKIPEIGLKLEGDSSSEELNGEYEVWTPPTAVKISTMPEIDLAFHEIAKSAHAHNVAFIQRYDAKMPCNGPAYSEGIRVLDEAARRHGGMTKQIIDAVNQTLIYEKGIFEVFDIMDRQMAGMETQAGSAASRRRAYIQIVDRGIRTYDKVIPYLEKGQDVQYRYTFEKKKVPKEVISQFLYAKKMSGEKTAELEMGMFREGLAAMLAYRSAFSQSDQARSNTYLAEARQHEQKSNQFRSQMVAELRRQLASSPAL